MSALIDALSLGASAITAGLMIVSLVILLVRYFAEIFSPNISFAALFSSLRRLTPLPAPSQSTSTLGRSGRRRLRQSTWALHTQMDLLIWIAALALLSRLLIFLSAMAGSLFWGSLDSFFQDFGGHWIRWDAKGYLAIAEHGYTMTEPENLVLLPLYPMLTKLLSLPLLGNTALAGTLLSNICLVGACWALYTLIYEQFGQTIAKQSVVLLLFSPLSVFFSVAYAESLFLFLTLLSILFARHVRFGAAIFVGALSAFTRLAGVLVIIPIYLEMLKYERSLRLWPEHKMRCIMRTTGSTIFVMLISLGFFAYLGINYHVAGDPLAFITVQTQHLNQSFGSLTNTLRYSVETTLNGPSLGWLLGIWLPQSTGICAIVLLLTLLSTKINPGDGLYSWAYLSMTLAPTWLLTGPRMIFCMYTTYLMLPRATYHNGLYRWMRGVFTVLMILYSFMYAVLGNVL